MGFFDGLNVDDIDVLEPRTAGAVPDGTYTWFIDDVTVADTSTGTPQLTIRLKTEPNVGSHWERFGLPYNGLSNSGKSYNPKAASYLKSFFLELEIPEEKIDSTTADDLLGIKIVATIRTRPDKRDPKYTRSTLYGIKRFREAKKVAPSTSPVGGLNLPPVDEDFA